MPDCCCLDCGRVYQASFPSPGEMAAAEAVLGERPSEARNWVPDIETVDDLKVENLTRGISIVPAAEEVAT